MGEKNCPNFHGLGGDLGKNNCVIINEIDFNEGLLPYPAKLNSRYYIAKAFLTLLKLI